jgi:hypothetical protein
LKLAPPTNYELEFIKWRIWEPLRRNQDYKNEYAKLKKDRFLNPDEIDAFCRRWELPFPVDPNCEFEKLHPPQWTFWERYKPLFDHAAFADNAITESDFIIDGKYLKVWIDLAASRNRIEAALRKELDEWLRKWTDFYGGMRQRKPCGKAVLVVSLNGKHLGILVNLEAPRTTRTKKIDGYIEPEIREILTEWLSKWQGDKEFIPRLSKKWSLCFQVYDMSQNGWPFPEIAIKLRIPIKTLHKQYKRAWESIYPGTPYPSKRYRKKEIAVETVETDCTLCPTERQTDCGQLYLKEGKLLCPDKNTFMTQDQIRGDYTGPDDNLVALLIGEEDESFDSVDF